jgi:two-component system sensor histidine kinase MtrB
LGLRARIAVSVVVVTVVATVAMAFGAYQLQAQQAKDRFAAAAKASFDSDVRQVRTLMHARPRGNRIEIVSGYLKEESGLSWTLLHEDALRQARTNSETGLYEFDHVHGGIIGSRDMDVPVSVTEDNMPRFQEHDHWLVASVRLGEESELVLVEYFNLQALLDSLSTLRWQLAVIASAVALLAIGAALVAATRIQQPIRTVARAARSVGNGSFDVRLPVKGRDELSDLSSSFNSMAEQLGVSIAELRAKDQQQRRFVSDVAHDLRTPVAAMVAAVDSLADTEPEIRSRSAELLGAQARRLAKLVEDLLEMSHFDAGVADFRPEPVDLPVLVADAVDLTTKDTPADVLVHGDTTVFADPRRLHTIVCNLLTNAVRYGAEPVTVTIDGTRADEVTLSVADSGPGIPEELQPILFDRFVRGDQARQPTEGSGLGLAIAQENALLHHGRIEAGNVGGAVFTLTLPRDGQAR